MELAFACLTLLQLTLLVKISQSRQNIFREDDEPVNVSSNFITMKFPDLNEIMLKNEKSMSRRHKSSATMVVPILENCRTAAFQSELKTLRRKVKCRPMDTFVELHSSNGAIMTPNAVIVKRCGGGSCTKPKSCMSLERKNTTFYVKSLDHNKLVCNSIEVSEDVRCGCACGKVYKCNPKQVFNENVCRCSCDNMDDFKNCMQNVNAEMRWDDKTCSCDCLKSRSCTTGTVWSSSECRCVKMEP